jgi:hypothetical protein
MRDFLNELLILFIRKKLGANMNGTSLEIIVQKIKEFLY